MRAAPIEREIRYGGLVKGFCSTVFVLGTLASTGAAQTPLQLSRQLTVRLALKSCPQLDESEVRRIFSAEVGTRMTDEGGPLVTDASAVCDGTRVAVLIIDPLTGKEVRRTVDLGARRGRERLVAIATAELLLASWAELTMNPDPEVKAEGPVAPRELAEAARQIVVKPRASKVGTALERALPEESKEASLKIQPRTHSEREQWRTRNLRLLTMGGARSFVSQGGVLLGGGLRLAEERFTIVSWAVDSFLETGRLQNASERYGVQSASFGATLAFFWRNDLLTARVGAGVRAGLIRTQNENAQVDAADVGIWGWPLLGTSLTAFGWQTVAVEINAEAGYSIFSPGRGAEVQGVWVSGQLGIGLLL